MEPQLRDRVAFVTGATSGLGRGIALRLAAAGAKVVAVGRRADRLAELGAAIGPSCHALQLDVGDRLAVENAVRTLPGPFREVSILVNNAGHGLDRGPAHRASLDDWISMVDTNIKGVLHCTHALLGAMVERRLGHIVNIGSVASRDPEPGNAVYSSTKAFLLQFSKSLKCDLIGTGVRTSYVAPGAAQTEFSSVRWRDDPDRPPASDQRPMLRPEDVAEAVCFALCMPPHVEVTELELMPHLQSFGRRFMGDVVP